MYFSNNDTTYEQVRAERLVLESIYAEAWDIEREMERLQKEFKAATKGSSTISDEDLEEFNSRLCKIKSLAKATLEKIYDYRVAHPDHSFSKQRILSDIFYGPLFTTYTVEKLAEEMIDLNIWDREEVERTLFAEKEEDHRTDWATLLGCVSVLPFFLGFAFLGTLLG